MALGHELEMLTLLNVRKEKPKERLCSLITQVVAVMEKIEPDSSQGAQQRGNWPNSALTLYERTILLGGSSRAVEQAGWRICGFFILGDFHNSTGQGLDHSV